MLQKCLILLQCIYVIVKLCTKTFLNLTGNRQRGLCICYKANLKSEQASIVLENGTQDKYWLLACKGPDKTVLTK